MTEGKSIIRPFSTTGIGSLPHSSPEDAVKLVLETFDIPFWPQLPARSFKELMIPQYSEGMPGIVIDPVREAVWVERDEDGITRFYETHAEGARSEISEQFAGGLYAFVKALKGKSEFLKGHITGPLTFTLGLKDSTGKPVYYDEELRQIALMLLKAKSRWQIDLLGLYSRKVIIFIDEPILSALGSTSYMGVSEDETLRLLKETVEAIKSAGGIPGIHCCGRADWPLLLETGIDILNFDAYGFADTLAIYPAEMKSFLERGGILAWGIVPTLDPEVLATATVESLSGLLRERLDSLSKNIPSGLLQKNIMLTPSCGAGSRTKAETAKIFELIKGLKAALTA